MTQSTRTVLRNQLNQALAAIKDAQAKAAERSQQEMARLTEGLNLPAGVKLPF